MTKYSKAAVGGTFDHFHNGHQQLLNTAVGNAREIIVGITSQQLSKTKTLSPLIEPYQTRKENVVNFFSRGKDQSRYQITELNDPFGPTITDNTIDALVVSEMTIHGADLVNQERQHRSLRPLPVIVTPMVADESGSYISSTEIRSGHITRQGKVFNKLFDQNINFSANQLEELKASQGDPLAIDALTKATSVVLVGDMVTHYFLEHNLTFDYAITDGKSRRQPVENTYPKLKKLPVYNEPGTINHQVAKALLDEVAHNQSGTVYQIEGEEDLLAFVPSLTEPLESVVVYGQPEGGIVMITLTESKKITFAKLINPQFI